MWWLGCTRLQRGEPPGWWAGWRSLRGAHSRCDIGASRLLLRALCEKASSAARTEEGVHGGDWDVFAVQSLKETVGGGQYNRRVD